MSRQENNAAEPEVPPSLMEAGLSSAGFAIDLQDEIWSMHSNDKIDIARQTGRVFADLFARLGARDDLRVMSLGCGIEPQLQVYQALAAQIFLIDIDQNAIGDIRQKARQRFCQNINAIQQDFSGFLDPEFFATFCQKAVKKPLEAVFLHHSLYYLPQRDWHRLIGNIYTHLLCPGGSIHCVLMSSRCVDPQSTTWLYNHFAGRFCGHTNDQDLLAFEHELSALPACAGARMQTQTTRVQFKATDFSELMAVIWMILLYPQVHDYSDAQMREIVTHIYRRFFLPAVPLMQEQDHLVITKPAKG